MFEHKRSWLLNDQKIFLVIYICFAVLALFVVSPDYGACQTNASTEIPADEAVIEVMDEDENNVAYEKPVYDQALQPPIIAGQVFEFRDLVEVRSLDSTIAVELYYATENNFTGQVLYNYQVCLLRRGTANKLVAANREFALDGYRLKIWDAYRPRSAQEIMWETESTDIYVADPAVGSNHNRGAAVDVTLVDEQGNELPMPTGFDDFSEKASRNYPDTPEEQKKNMEYLTKVMVDNGFVPIRSEWWHFNDSEVRSYDLLELTFEEWVSAYFSAEGEYLGQGHDWRKANNLWKEFLFIWQVLMIRS